MSVGGVDKGPLVAVVLCVALRVLLLRLFPSLGSILDQSIEFSTPVTSYRSLKEALVVSQASFGNGYYDGGVVHHPLLLIQALKSVPLEFHDILFILFDCLIVLQWVKLTEKIERKYKIITVPVWLPALVYAMNPLTVLSCLSKSSIVFTNWAIINSIVQAFDGNIIGTALFVSIAGYLSLYPILLIFPLVNFFIGVDDPKFITKITKLFLATLSFVSLLLLLSYKLNENNWNFLYANYVVLLNFEKVTPNLGLWWYFFIEIFTEFIPFFKAVFNLFLLSFVLPFSIRFPRQALFVIIVVIGWITLTKPYPVLGDIGFWLSFLLYFQPIAQFMRYKVFSMLLFIHGVMLSPIFYHLWIGSGSGNSNFFYAISLVNALAIGAILTDLIWAMLRHEYDIIDPNVKVTQI